MTGIELTAERSARAEEHFEAFGVKSRVTWHEGDAGEILPLLGGEFDLIFLDGPKAQYLRYLPECKRLLRRGGVLLSDDILLFGWGDGGEIPRKRRMLAAHIGEYAEAIKSDPELETRILRLGEGLGVSVKR